MKLHRKTVKILCIAVAMIALEMTGCKNTDSHQTKTEEAGTSNDSETAEGQQSDDEAVRQIAEIYRQTYTEIESGKNNNQEMKENAGNTVENQSDMETIRENKKTIQENMETIRKLIDRLGEKGYPAVDSENQINMSLAEKVKQFCRQVDAREEAKLTILVLSYQGGFTKYDFSAKDGKVDIVREYFIYRDGQMESKSKGNYRADFWQYTGEGYLLFEGNWFSEEHYALTLSEDSERAALRVEPLDETCRQLNREYILPVGYERNNLFLTDWSEGDFGELDFYDLYDIFYPMVYKQPVPYVADDNLGVGMIYQIPREEFENVIMTYFHMERENLQEKAVYDAEKGAYEYRPRGFYEAESPDIPYPEVTDYTENNDGTMTLTVQAVYANGKTSKSFVHEVVVRPLAGGGVEYVSNRVLTPRDNYSTSWHTARLTDAEWEENYGQAAVVPTEKTYRECLISGEEQRKLEEEALQAADYVKEIYENTEGEEQQKKMVALLGEAGYISVADDVNMENGEAVADFYSRYLEKKDAMVTVFDIKKDGFIDAVTFIYRKDTLQIYYMGIGWREDGMPGITDTSVSDIAEIKLTEKGYFIYAFENIMAHASLRQYWRTTPLSDECRELTRKYVYGLSYVNYNVLVTNWDSSNVEEILMPCMFEDIYYLYTGEAFRTKDGKIPAEEYEKIMTNFFPVSVEQLREHCGYDAGSHNYPYEMILASPYPPFGEVVDYTENADGTITLIVDGVWPDYNSDFAFQNRIVVQPFADGTFRYLSNSIEEKEMELPPIARKKE